MTDRPVLTPEEIEALKRDLACIVGPFAVSEEPIPKAKRIHARALAALSTLQQEQARLTAERDEKAAIVRATGHELDALRSQASAAEARREAAERRATRIVLDAELKLRAERAEAENARLREALEELDQHCEYALNTSGLRTAPPTFVPSAAKLGRGIVRRALAPSTETRE